MQYWGTQGLTLFQQMAQVGSVYTVHTSQPCCIYYASLPLSQYLACLFYHVALPLSVALPCRTTLHLLCCIATVIVSCLSLFVLRCHCWMALVLSYHVAFLFCAITVMMPCFYHLALPLQGRRPWGSWVGLCHPTFGLRFKDFLLFIPQRVHAVSSCFGTVS